MRDDAVLRRALPLGRGLGRWNGKMKKNRRCPGHQLTPPTNFTTASTSELLTVWKYQLLK